MRPQLAPKSEFDATLALIRAGDLAAAEPVPRRARVLAARREHAGVVGRAADQAQPPGRGADLLRTVVAEAPSFAKPHEDLGVLLLQHDRMEQAVAFLEKATRLDPGLETGLVHARQGLRLLGRGGEADRRIREMFRAFAGTPNDGARRRASARGPARGSRAPVPPRPAPRPEQRRCAAAARDVVAACAWRADAASLLLKAPAIAPDFLAACWISAIAQRPGSLRRGNRVLRPRARNRTRNDQALYLKAQALAPAAFTKEAIAAYREVSLLAPGSHRRAAGPRTRPQDRRPLPTAVDSYKECVRHRPEYGETYWSLANLKTYRFDDATLAEMERRVARRRTHRPVGCELPLRHRQGARGPRRFRARLGVLCHGNKLQRKEVSYDPGADRGDQRSPDRNFHGEFLGSAPDWAIPTPRRSSSSGCRARARRCSSRYSPATAPVEGTSELPYLGRLTTWLNRNRAAGINYPEAVRELDRGISRSSATTT